MKRVFIILLFILLISFCNAIEISNIECPDEVLVGSEFYCEIEVKGVNGLYDLKLNFNSQDEINLNKIWDGNKWQRSDWYVKSIISKDEVYKILLKIDKDYTGVAQGSLRIRENKETSFIEDFVEIEIINSFENNEKNDNEKINLIKKDEEPKEKREIKNISKRIINLNQDNNNSEKVVYESRTEKIQKFIPYVFSGFLMVVITFLLLRR